MSPQATHPPAKKRKAALQRKRGDGQADVPAKQAKSASKSRGGHARARSRSGSRKSKAAAQAADAKHAGSAEHTAAPVQAGEGSKQAAKSTYRASRVTTASVPAASVTNAGNSCAKASDLSKASEQGPSLTVLADSQYEPDWLNETQGLLPLPAALAARLPMLAPPAVTAAPEQSAGGCGTLTTSSVPPSAQHRCTSDHRVAVLEGQRLCSLVYADACVYCAAILPVINYVPRLSMHVGKLARFETNNKVLMQTKQSAGTSGRSRCKFRHSAAGMLAWQRPRAKCTQASAGSRCRRRASSCCSCGAGPGFRAASSGRRRAKRFLQPGRCCAT